MEDDGNYILIIFGFIICFRPIWAILCAKIADKKGFNPVSWFFYGLFCTWVAFIVILIRKPKYHSILSDRTADDGRSTIIQGSDYTGEDSWECFVCGRFNPLSVDICACGNPRVHKKLKPQEYD